MAFDFPANPTNGQTVTQGSTVYQWNGYAWIAQSGNVGPTGPQGPTGATGPQGPKGDPGVVGEAPTDGLLYARRGSDASWQVAAAGVATGDTPPSNPFDNSLWYETDSGALFLRYKDVSSTQWIQVNSPGVVLPPQDGNEYVMRNGVWRLKSQTVILDGNSQATPNIVVPTGARAVKFSGSVGLNNLATSIGPSLRVSMDGTTFLSGASDYGYSGAYFPSTGNVATSAPATAVAQAYLSTATAFATYPVRFEGSMVLSRSVGGAFVGIARAGSFQSANHYQSLYQFWNNTAWGTAPNSIRALNFGQHNASVTFIDSYVDLEWVY